MIKEEKSLELSALIHEDAEVYSFIVTDHEAGPMNDFDLPKGCRLICLYRDEKLVLPEETDCLKPDDEVILITRADRLAELKKRLEHPVGEAAS
ncbi:hypothetical protein GCM10009104_07600 [Marinobacterium maritimum]|uniref:RCK C-terminal domain-containing protein n=1 Tax=Marinobacterium maritimum TaxID=500162 RepID=A0ABN1I2Y9_9GAMM